MEEPPCSSSRGEEAAEEVGGEVGGEVGEETGEEVGEEEPRVGISMCGAVPLVWRAAEVRAARVSGVTGTLVGALPRQPRQNGRLGRPLQLRPEEARLLLDTRRAAVVGGDTLQGVGGAREREQYEEQQRRSFEEQSALALEDRRAHLLQAMTVKRGGGVAGEDLQARLEALVQSFSFSRSAAAVQLSTARAGPARGTREAALLWALPPPRPPQDLEGRFRVFRDLRRRGFYLTSAGKFGGDFLVYPGDPLRFHAHFIAVCVPLEDQLSVWDVLAVARLGSSVKKTVLMCSPAAGRDAILYTSLQWSGMV